MAEITPNGLRHHINLEERKLRLQTHPEEYVERIVRLGSVIGSTIERLGCIDRTMPYARSYVEHLENQNCSVPSGHVFIADELRGSKGRFTRAWHAPEGGLWGSVLYVNTLTPSSRLLIPLAAGIACCESIRASGAAEATVRWINDVLVSGYKVAGFLTEGFIGQNSKEEYILIGFGINLNNSEFPEYLKDIATSVTSICGQPIDFELFCYTFLAKLSWYVGVLLDEDDYYLREGNWSGKEGCHPLVERLKELGDAVGRRVIYGFDVMESPQYRAIVRGFTRDGGLILQLEDGSEIHEYSGEIRYL